MSVDQAKSSDIEKLQVSFSLGNYQYKKIKITYGLLFLLEINQDTFVFQQSSILQITWICVSESPKHT